MRRPRLYSGLAGWWPLLSAPGDYEEEAGFYRDILVEACSPRTVLELGSGGGNNASHLKRDFEMTLVDLSPEMIAVSRELNPECEHVVGDMRSLRLERTFDAVFLHDAVMYMTTEADLARALETCRLHCRPGGAALVAPDHFLETFEPGVSSGGRDGAGRSLRYLEWIRPPGPGSTVCAVDYAYLLQSGKDAVEVIHDRHELGLFPRARWLDLCRGAGFEVELRTVVHSGPAPRACEILLGRPAAGAGSF